ncbi:beta-adrenergic receptor kinase 1-like [Heterodontus francisci]|uniref:beta-adrenergic receptor kinase 1-like n=1 Tax=Heterodontus francisci TaxID=7792 RepID=UPI00355C0983
MTSLPGASIHLAGRLEPAARNVGGVTLPHPSIQSVMRQYLADRGELFASKMMTQRIGYQLLKDFCRQQTPSMLYQFNFYEQIQAYENLGSETERGERAAEIYHTFILRELIKSPEAYSQSSVSSIQYFLTRNQYPQELFQPMIQEITQTLSENIFARFLSSKQFTRYCQWKNLQHNYRPVMTDFRIETRTGRGSFSEMYKCEKLDTGMIYAMKCFDKTRLKVKRATSLALNELKILVQLSGEHCPFLVQLIYAFQTAEKLCLILDNMDGCDLLTLIQGSTLLEPEARFFAAELVLGLEFLHKRTVVHRDLKPSNIVLSSSGHLKISDMCLACDFSKTLPTATVGTHGYMAPEVLEKGTAYGSSADWFSLGCVLYRLLQGHTPIQPNKMDDYRATNRHTVTMPLELPETFTPELTSLLRGLLEHDVRHRLGCCSVGAAGVKLHPFFHLVEWRMVYIQEYAPPLIPPRKRLIDPALPSEDVDRESITLMESNVEFYRDFSVTIPARWAEEVVETIFWDVNEETDRAEAIRASKQHGSDSKTDIRVCWNCIMHGYISIMDSPLGSRCYFYLHPGRMEWKKKGDRRKQLLLLSDIESVEEIKLKEKSCLEVRIRGRDTLVLKFDTEPELFQWKKELCTTHIERHRSRQHNANVNFMEDTEATS